MSIKVSQKEACKYYEKAVGYYDKATNGEIDFYEKAFDCVYMASFGHHIQAQYSLGLLYEFGLGTTKCLEKAKGWFKVAADYGYLDAKIALERVEKKIIVLI